jgi:MSHA pilin protein MshC
MSRDAGFTLVELVTVILIVGILAAVGIPRFFNRSTYDARAFADQTQAMMRYGQKVAIAQRTSVFVVVSAGAVALCYDAACKAAVPSPATQGAFSLAAPAGVVLTPVVFSFNALGQPSAGQAVAVSGDLTRTIVVEPETGYVHS